MIKQTDGRIEEQTDRQKQPFKRKAGKSQQKRKRKDKEKEKVSQVPSKGKGREVPSKRPLLRNEIGKRCCLSRKTAREEKEKISMKNGHRHRHRPSILGDDS